MLFFADMAWILCLTAQKGMKKMNEKLIVSTSPHIQTSCGTDRLMLNVIIALMPAALASIIIFGARALLIIALSVIACVLSEYLWCKAQKKPSTVSDGSAVVTGLLLAFTLPVSVPWYIPVLGGIFAIIIAKELFGGLGNNFINPALAGRAFLLASFSQAMTSWTAPFAYKNAVDAETYATPLKLLKGGHEAGVSYLDMFFGNMGGSLGEVCALAILIGFIYLLITGTIKAYTTVSYVACVALMSWIFGYNGYFTGDPLTAVLTGGVMLGGVFMLTDYVTSPTTKLGNVIYGILAGLITVFIRVKGGYPEGVCYSILLSNILAPQIDKMIKPKKYGA